MKKLKRLLPLLAAAICLTTAGCGDGGKVIGENTINVKLLLGGYGKKWMESVIKSFEETYASEGYKINLINPSKMNDGNAVFNELLSGYAKKKVDLYFTGSLKPYRCVDPDTGAILVEDITESVYNQKAIKFDGTEETKTVLEKLDPSFGREWYEYQGKAYGFFYMKSIGSLVVNREKLFSLGFTSLPVTSNQFLDQVHQITTMNFKGQTSIKPLVATTASGGTTGYATVMMNSWFTQYSGLDAWNSFWSMNNPDGTYNKVDGYKVYEDAGLRKAAELLFNTYDYNNFVTGSKSYSISDAHNSLMSKTQGGVFVFDGDWALNETAADWPSDDDLRKLSFINVPVISALGTKLWGDMITDPEVCDNVLAKVATCSDEGKEVGQIKQIINDEFHYELSDESILEVCKARGVYNNRGVETGNAYVTKGIGDKHKEICSKFLRMIASDDFSRMYFDKARCFSPYSKEINVGTELLPFSRGHTQIATHKYASVIWPMSTGLRANIGALDRMFPLIQYFHSYALDCEDTSYNVKQGDEHYGELDPEKIGYYKRNADSNFDRNYDEVVGKWSEWMRSIPE